MQVGRGAGADATAGAAARFGGVEHRGPHRPNTVRTSVRGGPRWAPRRKKFDGVEPEGHAVRLTETGKADANGKEVIEMAASAAMMVLALVAVVAVWLVLRRDDEVVPARCHGNEADNDTKPIENKGRA